MTKARTTSNGKNNSRSGGKMTKVDGNDASIAPEGSVGEVTDGRVDQDEADRLATEQPLEDDSVEQTDELAAAIAAEGQVPDETGQPDDTTAEVDPVAQLETPLPDAVAEQQTGEQPEVVQAAADPFADLPLTKIEDYEFRDLTDAVGNDPFKYEAVHNAAVAAKMPMKPNWKHASAMITRGTSRREFRPGSVYGTIEQIVLQFGRAGVPAYVLVAKVRQAQIGNKRSKYCTALPPIGWAEGWIDTFVSKNFGKVMEKKAPAITSEVVAEVAQGDAVATAEAERIAA